MNKAEVIKEIWNLHRKADQNRSMHSLLLEKLELIQKISLAYITIGSAVSAMMIFAKMPSYCYLIPAFLSASLFISGLLISAFGINSKIHQRKLAVSLWGNWIRKTSNFIKVELDSLNDDEIRTQTVFLNESYRKVMEDTPQIPDSKFLKLKRKHLIKIEVSKALDGNPFMRIGKIKRELAKEKEKKKE